MEWAPDVEQRALALPVSSAASLPTRSREALDQELDADEPHNPRSPCRSRSHASPCLCDSVRSHYLDRTIDFTRVWMHNRSRRLSSWQAKKVKSKPLRWVTNQRFKTSFSAADGPRDPRRWRLKSIRDRSDTLTWLACSMRLLMFLRNSFPIHLCEAVAQLVEQRTFNP